LRRFLIAACALILAMASIPALAQTQTRVALVVGNGAYQHVPVLANPVNDATDVAASLQRLGFTVHRIADGTLQDMRRALLDFGQRVRSADIAFMFFAGHGMEIGAENWLVPVDAELRSDLDVDHEAVALRSIMAIVATASKLGLVVLDACRNNPFVAKMQRTIRTRAVDRGLTRVEPSGSVLVAYGARDGTTANDGSGRNSPFTAALLRHIETPGLEINFLFRNVRDDVLSATGREQEPFVYGALSKESIYLKEPSAVVAATSPVDELTWNLIKDTRDATALKRFVTQFPNSMRRGDAERRITALAADAEQIAAVAKMEQRELARSLQLELQRVGCFDRPINGEFDADTRAALEQFARYSSIQIASKDPSSETLAALRGVDKRVCPLICQADERVQGVRCVRLICPAGQVPKDGGCIAERSSEPGGRNQPAPNGGSSPKCFSFQGRQFCE
jgi:hypothetical protein